MQNFIAIIKPRKSELSIVEMTWIIRATDIDTAETYVNMTLNNFLPNYKLDGIS